jgi:hypothetical protein
LKALAADHPRLAGVLAGCVREISLQRRYHLIRGATLRLQSGSNNRQLRVKKLQMLSLRRFSEHAPQLFRVRLPPTVNLISKVNQLVFLRGTVAALLSSHWVTEIGGDL